MLFFHFTVETQFPATQLRNQAIKLKRYVRVPPAVALQNLHLAQLANSYYFPIQY